MTDLILWDKASIFWTAGSYSLSVNHKLGEREAAPFSRELRKWINDRYAELDLHVTAAAFGGAGTLRIDGDELLGVDPRVLKDGVNAAARSAANAVQEEVTHDEPIVSRLLEVLRGE